MKHQIILDTREPFQATLSKLIETFKRLAKEDKTLRSQRVSKVRIFVSALRMAYDADLRKMVNILENTDRLQTITEDRKKSKLVKHSAVYIYPNHMDYVKAGLGVLHIEELNGRGETIGKTLRIDEREYIHLCIYYLASLDDRSKAAAFNISGLLHDFDNKPRKPNSKK